MLLCIIYVVLYCIGFISADLRFDGLFAYRTWVAFAQANANAIDTKNFRTQRQRLRLVHPQSNFFYSKRLVRLRSEHS